MIFDLFSEKGQDDAHKEGLSSYPCCLVILNTRIPRGFYYLVQTETYLPRVGLNTPGKVSWEAKEGWYRVLTREERRQISIPAQRVIEALVKIKCPENRIQVFYNDDPNRQEIDFLVMVRENGAWRKKGVFTGRGWHWFIKTK